MYIHEAVKRAMNENKCIAREGNVLINKSVIKYKPTNTKDCIICISKFNEKPGLRWNPTAEDLVSDKWIVVD